MLGPAPAAATRGGPSSRARQRAPSLLDRHGSELPALPVLGPEPSPRRTDRGKLVPLRSRSGSGNGLTRLLYGRVRPRGSGSVIEMEFRTLGFVVVLLRLSLLGVLVLAAPLLEHLYESARNGGLAWRDAVPPACALIGTIDFLVAIEALARRMGARDERLLRERLLAIFEDVLPRS